MSTETGNCHDHHDHQASYYHGSWSCPELPWDSQQSESDQSSISFGRYSSESLAWERWSVFNHNRCREELEKLKNPGLVAHKKAYFEEYYKKIRTTKTLQAEQQEINSSDACQDAHSSNTGEETNSNFIVSKEEKSSSPISSSSSSTITILNSFSAGLEDQSEAANAGQQSSSSELNDKASMKDRIETSLSIVKAKNSLKKASAMHNPSSSSLKIAKKRSFVSSKVNQKENQLKNSVPSLQTKGTIASIRNKTKLESSRTVKTAAKHSDIPKPTLVKKTVHKADIRLLPSKKSDPKPAAKINRKITEVTSTGPVLNSLLARDKLVSSVSSVRAHRVKPSATPQRLADKLPKKLPAQSTNVMPSSSSIGPQKLNPRSPSQGLAEKSTTRLPVSSQSDRLLSYSSSIKAQKLKPGATSQGLAEKSTTRLPVSSQSDKLLSSSSSIRAQKLKPGTTSQGLAEKSTTRLPVSSQSDKLLSSSSSIRAQKLRPGNTSQDLAEKSTTKSAVVSKYSKSISHNKTVTVGLRNMDPAKRSADLSTSKNSTQSIAVIGQKSSIEGEKDKEGNVKESAGVGRDLKPASSCRLQRDRKPASSMVSSSQKAPNAKPVLKIAKGRSVDLKHDQ